MIPMTLPNVLPANSEKPPVELDHPKDDQDPAHGVEVGEYIPLVVYEDIRIVQGTDPIDDVERARNQQQRCCQQGSTHTSHYYLLGLIRLL